MDGHRGIPAGAVADGRTPYPGLGAFSLRRILLRLSGPSVFPAAGKPVLDSFFRSVSSMGCPGPGRAAPGTESYLLCDSPARPLGEKMDYIVIASGIS